MLDSSETQKAFPLAGPWRRRSQMRNRDIYISLEIVWGLRSASASQHITSCREKRVPELLARPLLTRLSKVFILF